MPPSACSNFPARSAKAPVNEPFMWPNSSLSISSEGIAAQFTSTKALVAPGRGLVQRARDQLLAGAVLAGDQHPGGGGPDLGDQLAHLLQRRARRPPSDSGSRSPRAAGRSRPPARAWASALRTVTSRRSVSSGFSRKSNAPRWVASTAVAMVPCPEIITTCARGIEVAEPGERLEAVEPGHLHVEEDEMGPELGVERDRLAAGGGDPHLQVLVLEHLLQRLADARPRRRRSGPDGSWFPAIERELRLVPRPMRREDALVEDDLVSGKRRLLVPLRRIVERARRILLPLAQAPEREVRMKRFALGLESPAPPHRARADPGAARAPPGPRGRHRGCAAAVDSGRRPRSSRRS